MRIWTAVMKKTGTTVRMRIKMVMMKTGTRVRRHKTRVRIVRIKARAQVSWLQQKSTTNYVKQLKNSIAWIQNKWSWNIARQKWRKVLTFSEGDFVSVRIPWIDRTSTDFQTTMHCGWVPGIQIPSLQAKVHNKIHRLVLEFSNSFFSYTLLLL